MTSDRKAPSPRLASIDRRQLVLRTVDVEILIEGDHSVRSIWELIGRLDLSLYHAQIEAVEGHAWRDHTVYIDGVDFVDGACITDFQT